MKAIFISIVILSASLIETSLITIPFTAYVIAFFTLFEVSNAVTWGFIAGLVLDILAFRYVGTSSFLFLTGYLLWERFSQKIQTTAMLYQIAFIVFLTATYDMVLVHRGIYPSLILRDSVIGVLLFLLLGRFMTSGKKSNRLKI